MGIKKNLTRYENVKAILDKADGGSTATYGPYGERGKFWELSLAELLTVEIAGLALIDAPPSIKKSCCAGRTGAPDKKSTLLI